MKALLLAVVVAVSSVFVGGCAGSKARTHVLVPAIEQSAGGVEADARVGLERMDDATRDAFRRDVDAFFAAILTHDEQKIREATSAYWPRVKEAATVGIDHKRVTIGENSAAMLTERLLQFDERLRQLSLARRVP